MAPKSAAPASSSSYATSSGEEEEEEEVSAAKKKNSSSSAAPNALKPSTTTIAAAPQPPKPSKPSSTAAAQAAKLQSSKPSSSTEDDDEDGEEEAESSGSDEVDESASDSGDDRSKPTPPPNQPQPPPKPTTTEASDTGSTDDSDSEPDSSDQPTPIRHSSRVANPSIKPLASKPMEPPSKPKKPVLAPVPDSDKKKKKAPEAAPEQESGGQKRQNFLRIWSEEDEIAILHGMADYHTKMGTVPSSSSDMDTFYNSVHKSIQMEVSKSQLLEKVRRLKKKYETIAVRGKNPSFTKPHEQTAYELSKKIWGENKTLLEDGDATNGDATEGDATDNSARKRRKTKEEHTALTSNGMAAHEDVVATNVKVTHPFLSAAVSQMGVVLPSSLPVNRVLELVDDTKVMALEEKYKKLRLLEIKNHLRQMDLMKETIKLVVDAIEKLG